MKETSPSSHSLSGRLLIAGPDLQDPNFCQTLVYLQEHNDGGSIGFILNRPVGKKLADIVPGDEMPDLLKETPLYFGGPVDSSQVMLVLFRLMEGQLISHVNPGCDELLQAMGEPDAYLRAFVGYAGWEGGQLEGELFRADWLLGPADRAILDDHLCTRLWPLYVSGDRRWIAMKSHFPYTWGLN